MRESQRAVERMQADTAMEAGRRAAEGSMRALEYTRHRGVSKPSPRGPLASLILLPFQLLAGVLKVVVALAAIAIIVGVAYVLLTGSMPIAMP